MKKRNHKSQKSIWKGNNIKAGYYEEQGERWDREQLQYVQLRSKHRKLGRYVIKSDDRNLPKRPCSEDLLVIL